MISEMETIQILSSRLREEELENERLRREKDAESEKVLRAVEDARVARESAEQYRAQLEEERKAQGDRIESMLKEVMMFITGKGTASLSESLSDSIIKKMQEQHAQELAEQKAADEDGARDEYVRPEGWDKPGSVFVKEEVVPKITYVPGYARGYNLHIQTYIVDGVEVTPDVFNKKCLATEEMVGMVLYMHYVEHVTVAQIYKELRKMGVNISEATLDSWMAIGIDEFKPLMEPTQKEIVASGEAYMDETHLLVKCDVEEEARHRNELISEGKAIGKPVPLRDDNPAGDGDTLKNRMHYLGKWLHNIISPKAKLSNFLYRDGDRGAYIAAEYLIGAIDFFLHCDGAKMYKSFEEGGKYEDMGIIRVACGSHVRRPFWKIRLTEEDARWVTEKMDIVFVKEDSYKGLSDEERKRRRGVEVAPILHEIKQRLDILKGEKSAPDAWKHPGLYEAVDYALREWKGIQNYLLTGSGDYTNNICEREMRTVGTLRNNSLFWGSHTSAKRLSVILTIVRSALMNSLNVYQYIVYCLKTIRSYKGDLADLLANKWKPSDTELMPILA